MVLPGSEQALGQFVNTCEMQYEMHYKHENGRVCYKQQCKYV